MGFRFRLGSFFVVALVLVQVLTGVLVYQVTRHELIGEGKRRLQDSAQAFAQQYQDMSERTAASVQVLALDYALRAAVAQGDEATLTSALRNHGLRVGASQMLLIGVDGAVQVDTARQWPAGTPFPYAELVDQSVLSPAVATVTWNGRGYWMAVVPVYAPDLVGYLGAAIPVDGRVLARLQQQSTLPGSIELVSLDPARHATVLARGRTPGGEGNVKANGHLAVALAVKGELPIAPAVVDVNGQEFVSQAVWVRGAQRSPRVAAVLGFSVDEALAPFRPVGLAWAGLLALGLTVGLVSAWLIARSVSRPVEELAERAQRIAAGDYSPPPPPDRQDELGQLANAFGNMAHAIADREARILHQAGHDHVTGLPNRAHTESAIQHALVVRTHESAALLMIGLGRMNEIVKTLGHVVADRLMQAAGGRLQASAGRGLLARATDTQLSIFLPGTGRAGALDVAYRIVEALGEPYRDADLTLDFAPAIGIALVPEHGAEAGVLLRRAEVAMIGALHSDDPIALYDPATDPHRPERLSLMGDLRQALERGGIHLHYQPKLNLRTGRIDSAEGLIRWQHPVVGAVAPDDFIALAEETGNIRRVTRWALGTGIAQAARWKAEGHAVRVSINVSARDLDDTGLPNRLNGLLRTHGVSPEQIVLEITESAIMGKPEAAIAVLRRLADDGIDLAIDDFGVGQSSFAYLRRLPVRELKIDKTFITHLARSREDRLIVSSIVELAHHLGYRVTAEGVDDADALAWLREIGCDHAQGYLIAPPLQVDAFTDVFHTARWPLPAALEG